VYGNAEESGFFRPLHGRDDLHALTRRLASLGAVERMGLVDHQWALVCAGRARLGTLLDLADAMAEETDADVLLTLARPLRFLGDDVVPDGAPDAEATFRSWVRGRFEPAFAAVGWQPRPGESDSSRVRRAALLGIAGGIGASETLQREAAARCDRYLASRRSLDANLADGVVALAARGGNAALHGRFRKAMADSRTPQEQRRFLLALADFRDPDLVDRSLALSLSDAVATQDVILLLVRLLANPAATEATWAFVVRRWARLRRRMPSLLASRLVEATPALRTPAYRREVARFFRTNPVPSGERALRQALERFDWYRDFRRPAALELEAWLDRGARRRSRGS
jgi:aminopeptidase N